MHDENLHTASPGVNRPFAQFARPLMSAGYSPIPIRPGEKSPAIKGWSECCKTPLSEARISTLAAQMPAAGLGVALGYNGVLAIDVDTDAPGIIAAIHAALPPSEVVKRGRKGYTAFYRATGGVFIPSRRLKAADRTTLIDVLGSGTQSLLPPTLHPEGIPYRWQGTAALDRIPVGALPEIPHDIADRLAEALKPWMPEEKKPLTADFVARAAAAPPEGSERKRYAAYARSGLAQRCAELAATGIGGRNRGLFELAAGLGRYVHHGIIPAAELAAAALAACAKNKLLAEDGQPACVAIIKNGLRFAVADPLPVLGDRPFNRGRR